MAREDVNIKVSADVAEAVRLWKAMEAGPQGMARELDALAAVGKKGAGGMATEFDKLVGKLTAVQESIKAAKKLFDAFIAAQREDVARQGNAAGAVDAASRRFFIQSGQGGNIDAYRKQILDIAVSRSVGPSTAFESATQLVSSGFSADQVLQGGVLDQFLQILAATNQSGKGGSGEDLAKATALFLNATGQMNKQGLAGAGVALQNLFQGTNLQLSNLNRFAPEAGTIYQMTGMRNEQLPILARLLDVADEAKASTAFSSGVKSLATVGASPDKVRALAALGLSPADVDFQGESFSQVQQRMTDALQNASPEQRNQILKKLFGAEGMLFGTTLLTPEGMAKTQQYARTANDRGGFTSAVEVGEGSLEGRRAREESREARAFFNEDFVDPDTLRKAVITSIEERNLNSVDKSVRKAIAGIVYDTTLAWTGDAEGAAHSAIEMTSNKSSFARDEANRLIEQVKAGKIEVQIELTDQDKVAIPHKSEVMKRSKQ